MLKKAVITSAGLGTRLLPYTKEIPKEMLPIFCKTPRGIFLKPALQLIFEQLYSIGVREFCFIIGRGKRVIEDYFTPDSSFIKYLKEKNKSGVAEELEEFYSQVENSTLVWINQSEPRGFGDAVRLSEPFVGNNDFLLAAGDNYIVSPNNDYLKKLVNTHINMENHATLSVFKVDNPKNFGVIIGERLNSDIIYVEKTVEKPRVPISNLALISLHVFHPVIFEALKSIKPGYAGEYQLTDAIQKLVEWKYKVYALEMKGNVFRLDIGTPRSYWHAIEHSYSSSGHDEN
ncbi:MAG: hypothetical protein DRJ44_06985 [Thermoprotei archaeon]|nr:MAG: hypothetical protein DRJ44_06985 [Thermoprotei archaeon]